MPSGVDEVLKAFIDLYKGDTLERWRELFLPGFIASGTNADGTVTTWNLAEFYDRQHGLFASGKPISETLHNTKKQVGDDLAYVRSDFVWTDGEAKRPGRLMMLLVAERGRFRIQSLTFSYRS